MMFNIFRLFKRKKEEIKLPPAVLEAATIESVKSKVDLISAQMDSLRAQNDALIQRIQAIEDMVKEICNLAKS